MASSLPISLPFPIRRRRNRTLPFRHSPLSFSVSASVVCLSAQNPSGSDREEVRWLREEQRWLREEQRWLREEQRWLRERESLLREISDLKLRMQALESRSSSQGASTVSETISSIGALLQVLKEKNRIAESGSSATPMVLEGKTRDREEVEEAEEVVEKRVIAAEEIRVSEGVKKTRTLRAGSEGEEVRELQVC